MPERHHRVGARRRCAQAAAALLVIVPKEPAPVDLEAIVRESMHNW
jgi:hypothetical protein